MKTLIRNSIRILISLSAVLLLCCVSNITFASYSWKQKADFGGTGRTAPGSFSINGKGYIGTGYDMTANRKDFWEYDPVTDVWTQKADFGGAVRQGIASFAIGGKGYMGLGSTTYPIYTFTNDWWEYDPILNTWTQKGNFPGTSRYLPVTFVIDSKGYMGTGWNQANYWKDFWEYDPALDAWTQKADVGGTVRTSAVGFAVNGYGYLGTGYYGGSKSDFWEYDPGANTWTAKANFPAPARYGATAFVFNNEAYVGGGGGGNGSVFYNDFYKFDPVGNTWTAIAAFPGTGRRHTGAFGIGVIGYMGTGAVGISSATNTFWEYSPDGPITNFNSAQQNLCPGTCTDFNNLTVGATSFQWFFPGATPDTSTAENPVGICYQTTGNYDVTLITTNANGTDTLTIQNYITLFPSPSPQSILQNGDTLFAIAGSNSYQWYYNGNIVNGATNYYYVATGSGNFNVVTTDTNGCEVEAVIYDVTADVSPIAFDAEWGMSVYPNPFHGKTNFTITTKKNGNVRLEIFDVKGELVDVLFDGQMLAGEERKLEFDGTDLPDAVYSYRVTRGSQVVNGRLVLIK